MAIRVLQHGGSGGIAATFIILLNAKFLFE